MTSPSKYILRNWGIVITESDGFKPPEALPRKLQGEVFGHPKFADGSRVTTSRVSSASGREVTTATGSVYTLEGLPHQEYLMFLSETGHDYDDEYPLGKFNAR